ncbi:PREDICTED: FAD synthase-like [Vollenhovia emeryi]|uniref:FAD synthase-like n=1 Tax=Vollenhovia emeryi TaxID=411798 RepID=UPI0005F586CF|nr:PREDICTED: FAD synthase-like [Vollenhovia emeryi]XP_011879199.1 PREDICTED: FAD synthase-like [Vollenhovia emeryi]XP_011879200.1 PREDICTED: FAD synthase-like [Vollenhovia emeryi]
MSLYQCLIRTQIRNYICVLSRSYVKSLEHSTAGIIVIGDEILKAQVKDTNSCYICNLLYKCGIKVRKISVIGDNVEEISKEIKDASKKYTYVITSGGIGPTHDDVTYEGLAKAFNDKLHYHPKLVDILKCHVGINDASSPIYKIAQIPQKASLKFGLHTNERKPNIFPYITLENVYVFPGSPVFLKKSFQNLYEELLSTNKRFVKDEMFINTREDLFANALSTVAKEFPNVSFGSYPVSNCRYFKAFVTIESDNENDTKRAKQRFCELNPANIFVNFDRTPHIDCITKYNNFLQDCAHRSIYEQSLEKLRQFYQNPECVTICIDGSIESSVVIHLAHICRTQLHSDNKLQVVYLKNEIAVDMEEFFKEMVDKYHLITPTMETTVDNKINNKYINNINMSKMYTNNIVRSHLRPILLIGGAEKNGKNKINGNMDDMNHFEIYNPLCNWTKKDVWTFASSLYLPYKFEA